MSWHSYTDLLMERERIEREKLIKAGCPFFDGLCNSATKDPFKCKTWRLEDCAVYEFLSKDD